MRLLQKVNLKRTQKKLSFKVGKMEEIKLPDA